MPPLEEPEEEYPFILVTIRKLAHYNIGSMTRRVSSLMNLYPEAVLELNPEDAKRLGILEGAKVKVWNKRGEVFYRAHITDRVPQGMVFTDFHFDNALTNILVSPGLDELMDTPEYKVSTVAVAPA
ncbi:MAG: hypothetical protein NZ850_07530 [Caldimicrobium sp.]|nr:hypothetical protein [Caldimicrobium sp.]